MTKYITFGSFNKNYCYILLTGLFSILTDFIYGYKLSDSFTLLKLFDSDIQKKLYNHLTIHEIFRYFGLFIILLLVQLYKYLKNNNNNNSNKDNNATSLRTASFVNLIYIDAEEEIKRNLSLTIFFTISIWIFQFYLTKLFNRSSLVELDYWMFELLIIAFFNSKILNYKLYSHQKCAIYYNTIFCTLLKFISLMISISVDGLDEHSLFKKEKYFIPIGIIIYILILILRSYSICKIKYLMDLKYISSTNILLYSSILGIIIFIIISAIETLIKCPNLSENIDLKFCAVSYGNKDSTYFDNFVIYFKVLREANFLDIIFEVIINFLGIISFFLYLYFYTLTLKYLTPVHYIFSNAIYYLLIQLIFIIYHKIKTGFYFDGPFEYTALKFHKFLLNVFSDVFAFFGFLVYLELVELNCFGLNYNLKKAIIERGIEEEINIGIDKNDQKDLLNSNDENKNNIALNEVDKQIN